MACAQPVQRLQTGTVQLVKLTLPNQEVHAPVTMASTKMGVLVCLVHLNAMGALPRVLTIVIIVPLDSR